MKYHAYYFDSDNDLYNIIKTEDYNQTMQTIKHYMTGSDTGIMTIILDEYDQDEHGKYLYGSTMWKRQENGQYKVI